MKSLDDVIKALEICSTHLRCDGVCPYHKSGCIDYEMEKDALKHLKDFRYILDNTVWIEKTETEPGYWKIPCLPESTNKNSI